MQALRLRSRLDTKWKELPTQCNNLVVSSKEFAASVDLQPVFNHYKCITYVCSYFTNQTECSQAIANAGKEARSSNMNIRDRLKKFVLLLFRREKLACKNVCIDVCLNCG